jgi:hypothetical protein
MPRNGSGVYSPPAGTFGIVDTVIASAAYDGFIDDLSTEITNSLNVQGTASMAASLNMGTFRVINAADPVAATDLATKEYVDSNSSAGPGMVAGYATNLGAPTGWLACDGSLISTTTYANLFSAIAYVYGGSGSNFNVPDFRGVFLRGFDNGVGLDFQGTRAPGNFQGSYLSDHFHSSSSIGFVPGAGFGVGSGPYSLATVIISDVSSSGLVNFSGTETTVANYPVLWCIKY